MNHRTHAFLATLVCVAVMSACSAKPQHKCDGYYRDVREFGYCDMGRNHARDLFERGLQ
jgi:hypothetical protein